MMPMTAQKMDGTNVSVGRTFEFCTIYFGPWCVDEAIVTETEAAVVSYIHDNFLFTLGPDNLVLDVSF